MEDKVIIANLIKQLEANIDLFEALRIRVARGSETFDKIEKQICWSAFEIKKAKGDA